MFLKLNEKKKCSSEICHCMLKLRRIPALTPAIPQFAFFQRNEVSPAATPHEIPRPSLGLASDPSYDVEPVPSAGRPTRARDSALPWIPVLLKQGETTQQYENAFKDWLRRRDAELDSLHSRPEVERRFRLDFADSRAWELRRKSVSTATRSHRARSREELLEMEEMSPDAFLRSVERFGPNGPLRAGKKLKPIAVVLRPNEPRRYFEQNFERWLESKEVTLAELQDDPEEERCYRQAFAYTRAREHVARVQCGYFSPTSNKQLRHASARAAEAEARAGAVIKGISGRAEAGRGALQGSLVEGSQEIPIAVTAIGRGSVRVIPAPRL